MILQAILTPFSPLLVLLGAWGTCQFVPPTILCINASITFVALCNIARLWASWRFTHWSHVWHCMLDHSIIYVSDHRAWKFFFTLVVAASHRRFLFHFLVFHCMFLLLGLPFMFRASTCFWLLLGRVRFKFYLSLGVCSCRSPVLGNLLHSRL